MGKPIRSQVCDLSCDFKETLVMPTMPRNETPVQLSHDKHVISRSLWTFGTKELLESDQTLFQGGAREGLGTRLVQE